MLRGAVCIARVGETRVDETRGWVDEGGLVDERRGAVRLQGSSDPGGPRQRGKRGTAKSCSASGFKQPWRAVAMQGGGGHGDAYCMECSGGKHLSGRNLSTSGPGL